MFKYKLYMHNLNYNYICVISNLILRNIYWLSKTIFILNKEIGVENGKIMSKILKLKYYFFLLLWQDKGSEKFTPTQSHTGFRTEIRSPPSLLPYHSAYKKQEDRTFLYWKSILSQRMCWDSYIIAQNHKTLPHKCLLSCVLFHFFPQRCAMISRKVK